MDHRIRMPSVLREKAWLGGRTCFSLEVEPKPWQKSHRYSDLVLCKSRWVFLSSEISWRRRVRQQRANTTAVLNGNFSLHILGATVYTAFWCRHRTADTV